VRRKEKFLRKRFCLKYLGVDEWVETGFKESCYTFKKSD
jgi:hypothetical protein